MINYDVVLEKVNRIQNCLERIHNTVRGDLERLELYDVQDIVVLNLQRAVQLTIGLATHVVRSEKWGLPQTLKETFQILHRHHMIDTAITDRMEKMVGFRNIAVNDYEAIHTDILKSIVQQHLKDFETFYTQILTHYKIGQ